MARSDPAEPRRGHIYVLAGVNGAGKSSVLGEAVRAAGAMYYNPDEATRLILAVNPGATLEEANAAAWERGVNDLRAAIAEDRRYAFETTLGGTTVTRLLEAALDAGMPVTMRYVGLESPELHIRRVAARVAAGGHDIPEGKIRARYETSRRNVVRLLPRLTTLEVWDNSAERPTDLSHQPPPVLLLRVTRGRMEYAADLVPRWAAPIIEAARALPRWNPT